MKRFKVHFGECRYIEIEYPSIEEAVERFARSARSHGFTIIDDGRAAFPSAAVTWIEELNG